MTLIWFCLLELLARQTVNHCMLGARFYHKGIGNTRKIIRIRAIAIVKYSVRNEPAVCFKGTFV